MKSITRASILALSLLSLAAPQSATAQTAGGRYQFIVENDLWKYVEFDARAGENGSATGPMTFTDQAKIADEDLEEGQEPGKGDPPPEFIIKVEFDAMTVEKNRAVMNGTIRDSSHRTYIGRWVQLVVEDNGVDVKRPDQLTWGFCKQQPGGWIPTDSELKYDDGAFRSWWATDAERRDDVGIPSKSRIPGEMKSCEMFKPAAYDFVNLRRWEGDIQVRQ